MATLEAENMEMSSELAAIDPAFFEELEDLKHDHHVLQQRCAQLEGVLEGLPGVKKVSGEGPVYVNMILEQGKAVRQN